jgi:hypothetical protein
VLVGCNGDVTPIDTPDDPCMGVTCSGHGDCAVVGSDTAVCLCDPGYHADGDDCVETVAGAECDGVSCANHGTCVVVSGEPDYPLCLCDEGYQVVGGTTCVADATAMDPCDGVTCSGARHLRGGVG